MSEQIEELLRDGMRHGVDTLSADNAFQDRAIAHGVASRRTHRRTVWLSSAAGAAAVLAISVSITAVAAHDRDPSSTHDIPPITDTPGDQSPLGWARRLPEGASPTLAYVLDGALHQGDTTVPVPGDRAEVIGDTVGGWLVFKESNDQHGNPTRTAYGVLTASGVFKELPADPYQGSVQVQALSPDGNTFATGGVLIDLRTLHIVGRTPNHARFASNWTTAGLLYLDGDNLWRLWNEGAPSVPVDAASFTSVARDAAVAVTDKQGGCGRVVRIRQDGTLEDLYTGCDDSAPLSVSPDGRLTLTWGLGIVDVDSGASLGAFDIPADVAAKWHGWAWWENDENVLLSVVGSPPWRDQVGDANGSRPAVIVRCDLSSMTCQRAGPELVLDPSTSLDLK
jgi:hypothetical protein